MAEWNDCPNPGLAVNSTGWSVSGGTGVTGGRFSGLSGFDSTFGYRATQAGATGSLWVFAPTVSCTPGQAVTVTTQGRPSIASSCSVQLYFVDANGAFVGAGTVTSTATSVAANAVHRASASGTAPAGTAGYRAAFLARSMTVGSTLMATAARYGGTTYADGNTTGWAWEGAAGASTSVKVQAEQYGAAQVGQGTGTAVVSKPAGKVADAEPATLSFKGTSGTIVSAIVQRFRYVDPTNPLKAAPTFGGNTTATPTAMVAPSVTWADRDALASSWGLRTAGGTWTGPATMDATAAVAPGTGQHKAKAGSEIWSSGTTSGTRTATYTAASRFHSMSVAVRGALAASGLGVELLLAHIYLDSNGTLGDLVLPAGWTVAGSAANATPNTLVHAALAYKVVAAERTAVQWKATHAAPDVVANGEFENDSYQRQNNAGTFNDNTVPWPVPTLPASGGRPGRMIALSIPAGYRRYEVVPKHAGNDVGDPAQFFSMAVRFPPGFPIDFSGFQIFDQLHHADDNFSPPVAFEARGNGIRLTGGYGLTDPGNPTVGQHDQQLVAAPTLGVWHSLVYEIENWSELPNVSKISVWWDGVPVLTDWTLPCPTIVPHDNGVDRVTYRKVGIYRSSTNVTPLTIEQAGHAAGPSYASVDPAVAMSGVFTDCASDFTTDPTTTWPISYGATVTAGQLRLNATNGGGGPTYSGRKTADQPNGARALTGAWLEVVQVPAADPGGSPSPGMSWLQAASQPAGTRVGWEYDPRSGKLLASSQVNYGGVPTELTYDPVAHRWWGVWIEASTTGYTLTWQTSPTAQAGTWTVQRFMAAPAWILGRDLSWSIETYRTGGVSDLFVVDNVCITPTVAAYQGAATAVSGTRAIATGRAGRPIPESPVVGADALQRRTLSELRGFAQWLATNGVDGFVGEFAVPGKWAQWGDPAQQTQWNALLEADLAEADRLGIHTAMWASGPTWDQGYPLALHVGVNVGDPLTIRNAGVQVVAGHPSRNGRFHGLNLSGLEAGVATFGGGTVRSSPGYTPSAADVAFIATDGIDFTRLPVAWERLQPTLGGALSTAELARVEQVLTAARANGVSVLVEQHSYGRYTRADGTVLSICGGGITDAQLVDFWTRFSTWLRADPDRNATVVGLGIVNEPHDLPGGAAGWQTTSQAVLTALRNAGDTRLISIGGYGWSSLTDWATNHPSWWITDPAQNVVAEGHHYWDTSSDASLGPRSGTYQQPKAGGGVETLTYARELAAAEAQTAGAGTATSGTLVTAAGPARTQPGQAAAVSGTRATATSFGDYEGAPATAVSGTTAAAEGGRATTATATSVTGTRASSAPSVPGAGTSVSGTIASGDGQKSTTSTGAVVSGTVVSTPDGAINPPAGGSSTTGTRALAASPVATISPGAAPAVSGTTVTGSAVRATPGAAAAVSGTTAAATGTPGVAAVGAATSATRTQAAAPAATITGAANAISGTTTAGAVMGLEAVVSGTRATASDPAQVLVGAALAISSTRAQAASPAASVTPGAARAVSGTVVAGAAVTNVAGAPASAVTGTRVSSSGVTTRFGVAVSVFGTVVLTPSPARDQPSGAVAVSATLVTVVAGVPFRPVFVRPRGQPVRQRPAPRTELLVVETVTGRVVNRLPYTTLSWSSPLNGIGQCSGTIPVVSSDAQIGALDALDQQHIPDPRAALDAFLTGGWRFSLVPTYGSACLMGGPLLPSDDIVGDRVKVAAVGLERVFEKRVLNRRNGTGTQADPSRDVVLGNTTVRGAIYRLVAEGMSTYGGTRPNRMLPITCKAPPPLDGLLDFTWPAYDLVKAWKAITDLIADVDGPDVRLEPYLRDTEDGEFVFWDLEIGDPYLPASGNIGPTGPLPWTFSPPNSKITRTIDPVGLATSYYAAGDGQDRDKLIARADDDRLVRLGFPDLEEVDTSSGEAGGAAQDAVDRNAESLIGAHATPTDTIKIEVPIDGSPNIGMIRRGDLARLELRAGYQHRRIIDVSGGDGRWATLSCDAEADLNPLVGV